MTDYMYIIPISKIGPIQLIDVEHSLKEIHNKFFRTCTVYQEDLHLNKWSSSIGDTTPTRMVKLYGKDEQHWNRHFIVQVAGCPFRCPYCYVDNLNIDTHMSAEQLVDAYLTFKVLAPDIHVFHLMGGAPGRYCWFWQQIRDEMDSKGLQDDVLLSNVILVEDYIYGSRPWKDIPISGRFLLNVCLKGTGFLNFKLNTGKNMFWEALEELKNYIGNPKVYYSLIEYTIADFPYIIEHLNKDNVDLLHVKMYEVTKRRMGI